MQTVTRIVVVFFGAVIGLFLGFCCAVVGVLCVYGPMSNDPATIEWGHFLIQFVGPGIGMLLGAMIGVGNCVISSRRCSKSQKLRQ